MKAIKLLLTCEQRKRVVDWRPTEEWAIAVARAQAAKVLAVLVREAKRNKSTHYQATHFVEDFLKPIIKETGLTWPMKAKE